MKRELSDVLEWCSTLNIQFFDYLGDFVTYQSPSFEQKALAAEGVRNYPLNWRRADLIVLKAGLTRPNVARPRADRLREWREVCIGSLRIRVLKEPTGRFEDPRLISLTENDQPVTVSRRELAKQRAKIWTSCNQIFDCRGTELYFQVADAISAGGSPIESIERFISRPLSLKEQEYVAQAALQTRRLLNGEKDDGHSLTCNGLVGKKAAKVSFDVDLILRKAGLEKNGQPRIHLAIFVEPFLTYVLDGSKTVESRFSITRRAPFKQVEPGDLVLIKRSGGPVVGSFEVDQVWSYTLDPKSWSEVKAVFADALRAQDPDFWKSRAAARFATLMRVRQVKQFSPFNIDKRDMRGWVILREPDPKNRSNL